MDEQKVNRTAPVNYNYTVKYELFITTFVSLNGAPMYYLFMQHFKINIKLKVPSPCLQAVL